MDIDELLREQHDFNHDIIFDPIKTVTIKLRQKLNSYIWLNKICNFYDLPEKLNDIYSLFKNKSGNYKIDKNTPKNTIMKIVSSCGGLYHRCDYCTNTINKTHHSEYSYYGIIHMNGDISTGKILFVVNKFCFPYFMFVVQIAPFVPNYLLLLCSQ